MVREDACSWAQIALQLPFQRIKTPILRCSEEGFIEICFQLLLACVLAACKSFRNHGGFSVHRLIRALRIRDFQRDSISTSESGQENLLDDGVARYLGLRQCDKNIHTLPFTVLHVSRLLGRPDASEKTLERRLGWASPPLATSLPKEQPVRPTVLTRILWEALRELSTVWLVLPVSAAQPDIVARRPRS